MDRVLPVGTQGTGKGESPTVEPYSEGVWHRHVIEGLMISGGVYVEIGIRGCETINQVAPHCREAHGVDTDPNCFALLVDYAHFWNLTSDDFWKQYDGPSADVIFIDADHSEAQVRHDFTNALDCLARNGIIVMHDTYPFMGDYLHPGCGGAHLVAAEIAANPSFRSFTIPRFPGLTLVSLGD